MKKQVFLLFIVLLLAGCQTTNSNPSTDSNNSTTSNATETTTNPIKQSLGAYNDYLFVVRGNKIYFGLDEESFKSVYNHNSTEDICMYHAYLNWYNGCGFEMKGHYISFNGYNGVILNPEDGSVYKPKYAPNGEIIYLPDGSFKDINKATFGYKDILSYNDSGEKFILIDTYYNFYYYNSKTNQTIDLPKLAEYNQYVKNHVQVIPLNDEYTKFAGVASNKITLFDINDTNYFFQLEHATYRDYRNGEITYKNSDGATYKLNIETKVSEMVSSAVILPDGSGRTYAIQNDLIVFQTEDQVLIYNIRTGETIDTFSYKGDYAFILNVKDVVFIPTSNSVVVYSLTSKTVLNEYMGDFEFHSNYYNDEQVVIYNQSNIIWYNINGTGLEQTTTIRPDSAYPIVTSDFVYFTNTNTLVYKDSTKTAQIPNNQDSELNTAYLLDENKLFVSFNDGNSFIVYKDKIEKIEWLSTFLKNN